MYKLILLTIILSKLEKVDMYNPSLYQTILFLFSALLRVIQGSQLQFHLHLFRSEYYGMIAALLVLAGLTVISAAVAGACHRRAKFLRDKQGRPDPARIFSPSLRQLPPIAEISTSFGGLKQSAKSQFHRLRYSAEQQEPKVKFEIQIFK